MVPEDFDRNEGADWNVSASELSGDAGRRVLDGSNKLSMDFIDIEWYPPAVTGETGAPRRVRSYKALLLVLRSRRDELSTLSRARFKCAVMRSNWDFGRSSLRPKRATSAAHGTVEVEGAVKAETVPVNESVTEESKLGKRDLDEKAKSETVEESPPKKEKETAAEAETSNEAA